MLATGAIFTASVVYGVSEWWFNAMLATGAIFTASVVYGVSEWWFNAMLATGAIFTASVVYGVSGGLTPCWQLGPSSPRVLCME